MPDSYEEQEKKYNEHAMSNESIRDRMDGGPIEQPNRPKKEGCCCDNCTCGEK